MLFLWRVYAQRQTSPVRLKHFVAEYSAAQRLHRGSSLIVGQPGANESGAWPRSVPETAAPSTLGMNMYIMYE